MKKRFNSLDVVAALNDLQSLCGMRVIQVYDVDSKTYLFKLQQKDDKKILLIESGVRFHTTDFEWPKNITPSGFCMKMRKHLNNKRLTSMTQIGCDRIVDFTFGSGEAACHLILELYNRGNLVLTDSELLILNVLRPHCEGDRYKFAVREKYPTDRAKERLQIDSVEQVEELVKTAKSGDLLKTILLPHIDYGPSLLEHLFETNGLSKNSKWIKDVPDAESLFKVLAQGEQIFNDISSGKSKGIIVQKKESKLDQDVYSNQEFEPYLFKQHEKLQCKVFPSYNNAIDEFFSTIETQKIDMKALQLENEAIRKVEKIRQNQADRMAELHKKQEIDRAKAELIKSNVQLVDQVILAVRQAIASQISWDNIQRLVDDKKKVGDPIASVIHELNLSRNQISVKLSDPFNEEDPKEEIVPIDLGHSAFGNAKLYYSDKKSAADKEQRTLEVQGKALKSAEKKVVQVMRDVKTSTNISKARKVYWFEKFYWFISSENFMVVGGRDQQQNEILVKRYLRQGDIYVHADVHGASSIIVKNPSMGPIPPKTLYEAGTMAACYCTGWDAKIVSSVWWVYHDQVSKTPPTGEYLTTGSFIIRGKKNFLPPVQLAMGIGFLFMLEESSVSRHTDERKVKTTETITDRGLLDGLGEVPDDMNGSMSSENNHSRNASENSELNEKTEESNDDDDASGDDNDDDNDDPQQANVNANDNHEQFDDKEEENVEEDSAASAESDENASETYKPDKGEEEEETFSGSNLQSSPDSSQWTEGGPDYSKLKRGQRSKLKKIQQKYKHQDVEEKMLRMSILQSAGQKKETKKDKKLMKKGKKIQPSANQPRDRKPPQKPPQTTPNSIPVDEDDEEVLAPADFSVINYLTGVPVSEDELLFSLPVIAPYSALLSYKYKVKLIPGTTKRGKASNSVIDFCQRSKEATTLEKDLIKHVNEQQIARNLPGKVKIATANFAKAKK